MRRPLTAAVLLLVLGAASAALARGGAQLPATPQLPSFGKGLFAPRAVEAPGRGVATPERGAADRTLPGRPTLLGSPPTTLAGREATLQVLQDCYARQAGKVRATGSADTRVRRLRQLCENEEIADTRAWLKWSKIGDARQSRRIVNAIQQDDAERALAVAQEPAAPKKP